jgi:hypothetical protein
MRTPLCPVVSCECAGIAATVKMAAAAAQILRDI